MSGLLSSDIVEMRADAARTGGAVDRIFLWLYSSVLSAEPGNNALNDSYRFIDGVFCVLQTAISIRLCL